MLQDTRLNPTILKSDTSIEIDGDIVELSDGILLIQDKNDSKVIDLYALSTEE